jgi:hypothetical protein
MEMLLECFGNESVPIHESLEQYVKKLLNAKRRIWWREIRAQPRRIVVDVRHGKSHGFISARSFGNVHARLKLGQVS